MSKDQEIAMLRLAIEELQVDKVRLVEMLKLALQNNADQRVREEEQREAWRERKRRQRDLSPDVTGTVTGTNGDIPENVTQCHGDSHGDIPPEVPLGSEVPQGSSLEPLPTPPTSSPLLTPLPSKEPPTGARKVPEKDQAVLWAIEAGLAESEAEREWGIFLGYYGGNGWRQGNGTAIKDCWLTWTGWVHRELKKRGNGHSSGTQLAYTDRDLDDLRLMQEGARA